MVDRCNIGKFYKFPDCLPRFPFYETSVLFFQVYSCLHLLCGFLQVRVCGREDAYIRWPYIYDRLDIFKPFVVARALGAFDVSIDVRGGGPTGQAMAARLAIGRALVHACPDCKEDLEKGMLSRSWVFEMFERRQEMRTAHYEVLVLQCMILIVSFTMPLQR